MRERKCLNLSTLQYLIQAQTKQGNIELSRVVRSESEKLHAAQNQIIRRYICALADTKEGSPKEDEAARREVGQMYKNCLIRRATWRAFAQLYTEKIRGGRLDAWANLAYVVLNAANRAGLLLELSGSPKTIDRLEHVLACEWLHRNIENRAALIDFISQYCDFWVVCLELKISYLNLSKKE